MNIEINILSVIAATVVAYIIGALWYSVLFRKQWMIVTGFNKRSDAEKKAAAQEAGPLYIIQLIITFIEAYVLAHFMQLALQAQGSPYEIIWWALIGIVFPTLIGAVMWSGVSREVLWKQISIQAACQVVTLTAMALVIGLWM